MMEQKSGKREYGTNRHVEKHYVQMLLYLALLHYNYNLRNDEISSFLLYSKYEDGLMKEGPAPENSCFKPLKCGIGWSSRICYAVKEARLRFSTD